MNLFEHNKAERRERILGQAKKLVARRGFERLTMRELADASRVSVPTIYNLIGGKHAVVGLLLEQMMARIAQRYASSIAEGFVARVCVLIDAGLDELLDTPRYTRELVSFFLTSNEVGVLRRDIDDRNVAIMAAIIGGAQQDRLIAPWVYPETVSTTMYAQYMAALIAWAKGDIDGDELRQAAHAGAGLVLLGVAQGAARAELEQLVRQRQWTNQEDNT